MPKPLCEGNHGLFSDVTDKALAVELMDFADRAFSNGRMAIFEHTIVQLAAERLNGRQEEQANGHEVEAQG